MSERLSGQFLEQHEFDQDEHTKSVSLDLNITPEKLSDARIELGPGGIGAFKISEVLKADQLTAIKNEINGIGDDSWHDRHNQSYNRRDMLIIQNYRAFALKLDQGDMSMLDDVPAMMTISYQIEKLIQDHISEVFPSLRDWTANEVACHQYDNQELGLSYHADNPEYAGIIAILSVDGACDFGVRDDEKNEHIFSVEEGDLMLVRANGLYPISNPDNKPFNLCPDHAVINLRDDVRTSIMVRSNSKPFKMIKGFAFNNVPASY